MASVLIVYSLCLQCAISVFSLCYPCVLYVLSMCAHCASPVSSRCYLSLCAPSVFRVCLLYASCDIAVCSLCFPSMFPVFQLIQILHIQIHTESHFFRSFGVFLTKPVIRVQLNKNNRIFCIFMTSSLFLHKALFYDIKHKN